MLLKERSICSVSLPATSVDLESQHTLTSLLMSPLLQVSLFFTVWNESTQNEAIFIRPELKLRSCFLCFWDNLMMEIWSFHLIKMILQISRIHVHDVFRLQLSLILLRTWSGAIRVQRPSSCPGSLQSMTVAPISRAMWWTSVSVVPTSGNPVVTPSPNWSKS